MKDTKLIFTPPAGPGQPSVLDLSAFENLGDFSDALESAFRATFPGVSLEQLLARSKGDVGFRTLFAPLVALAWAAGATSARTAAAAEATAATARAAQVAAAAVRVCTFEDAIAEKIKSGATKAAAVAAVVRERPELHRQFLAQGGGKL